MKNLYIRPFVNTANLADVVPKYLNSCEPCLSKFSPHHFASIKIIEVSVNFGEYANPSFESQVETVSKARQGGLMSVETFVEELYGDSKSDDWKAEEVQRIKEEQGIASEAESSSFDDLAGFADE